MSELNENEIPSGLPLEQMRERILPKNILKNRGSLYTFDGEKVIENKINISSSPQAVFWDPKNEKFVAKQISGESILDAVIKPYHLSYTIPDEYKTRKDDKNIIALTLSRNEKNQKLEISPDFNLTNFLSHEIIINKDNHALSIKSGSLNNPSPCLIVKKITTKEEEEGQQISLSVDLEVAEWGIGQDSHAWSDLVYQFDIYKKEKDGNYSSSPIESGGQKITKKRFSVKIITWEKGCPIDIKVNMKKIKDSNVKSVTVFYYNNN